MNTDKEHMARKMMDEEYGKDIAGCLKVTVLVALALIAIGVAARLLSL